MRKLSEMNVLCHDCMLGKHDTMCMLLHHFVYTCMCVGLCLSHAFILLLLYYCFSPLVSSGGLK